MGPLLEQSKYNRSERQISFINHLFIYLLFSVLWISKFSMLPLGLLVIVAVLWGGTNPFINRGSVGVEHVKGTGLQKKISEIIFLATRWSVISTSITHLVNL